MKRNGGKRRAGERSIISGMSTKRILVPVEFSDSSKRALRTAVMLAKKLDAKITLLHVVEVHVTGSWPFDVASALAGCHAKPAAAQLNLWATTEVPSDVLEHSMLLYGAPAHEIVQLARDEHFDLIILSTHCRTGFQYALLGSVTEGVLQKAPCPVLAIPMSSPPSVNSMENDRAKESACPS